MPAPTARRQRFPGARARRAGNTSGLRYCGAVAAHIVCATITQPVLSPAPCGPSCHHLQFPDPCRSRAPGTPSLAPGAHGTRPVRISRRLMSLSSTRNSLQVPPTPGLGSSITRHRFADTVAMVPPHCVACPQASPRLFKRHVFVSVRSQSIVARADVLIAVS